MPLTSPRFAGNRRLQTASENSPPLRKGETSDGVAALQQALLDDGFPMPISTRKNGAPDGIYGDETAATVRKFQAREGLTADGVAGRHTLARLDEIFAPAPPAEDEELDLEIEGPFVVPQLLLMRAEPFTDGFVGSDRALAARRPPKKRRRPPKPKPPGGKTPAPPPGTRVPPPPPGLPPGVTEVAITAEPRMPELTFIARVDGADPLVLARTEFAWEVKIEYDARTCRDGPARQINLTRQFKVVGPKFTFTLSEIRGGDLTATATAVVDGKAVTDVHTGTRILGTNPKKVDLLAALPNKTLRRIVPHESLGGKQFVAPANGGVGRCPLWSSDEKGGVGLAQLTIPPPSDEQVWNWRANVAGCLVVFNQKVAKARAYPGEVARSSQFRKLVDDFNKERAARGLKPLRVTVPAYTSGDFDDNLKELELDTIRGYNGYAGKDAFGGRLHEFRVVLDAGKLRVVKVNEAALTGETVWERVPVGDRPHDPPGTKKRKFGNPNYVNDILAIRL